MQDEQYEHPRLAAIQRQRLVAREHFSVSLAGDPLHGGPVAWVQAMTQAFRSEGNSDRAACAS